MGTTWTSSNPSVAIVSNDGLIHALSDGSTTLTASYAGLTASIFVNVGNKLESPDILTDSLRNGITGWEYSAQLQASGTPLIYWRLIDGRLPGGLELSSEGEITGTPNETGIFTFTLEASNIQGTNSRELSITIEDENSPGIIINANIFPDANFRNYILEKLDYNKDGSLNIGELNASVIDISSRDINSVKGIEYFTALKYLTCPNNKLTELDMTSNIDLLGIACSNNLLTNIKLDNCKKLNGLWAGNNQISYININNCTELENLELRYNNLTYLDVSNCEKLKIFYCEGNRLENIIIGNKPSLSSFACYNNQLLNLDVSKGPALRQLYCSANMLTNINLDENAELEALHCQENKIIVLDLRRCPKLTDLICDEGVKIIYHDGEKPSILTKKLGDGITGQKYEFQFTANGTAPITWKFSGQSPQGLTLSEAGLLTGTLTKNGTINFTVKASNIYGDDERDFTLTATAGTKPTISTQSALKNGTCDKNYNAILEATGSVPITWNVVSGKFPSGLTLGETTGVISGTPTKEGKFKFKVRAANGAGRSDKSFTIIIGKSPIISTSQLSDGITGKSYKGALKASGTKSISWSVISGAFPEGLKLNKSSGKITGKPKYPGTFNFKIKADNNYGRDEREYTINIAAKPSIMNGTTLETGTIGKEYSVTLQGTGTTPLKWSLKSGKLPDGLTFSSSGKISGTPKKAGNLKFKIKLENSCGNVMKSFKLKISAPALSSKLQEPVAENESKTAEDYRSINVNETINVPENVTTAEKYNTLYFIVAAELPVVSVDKEGLYDFDVELSDEVPEGAELIYIANSSKPSEDDNIAEFYDYDTGEEISTVPTRRKITISIWLNPERIYAPVIAVKH